jgi:hypothetical protein
MTGGGGTCHFFNYIMVFDLQLRIRTENRSQRNRLVLHTCRCVDFVASLGAASVDLLSITSTQNMLGDMAAVSA